jgi:hypothetical protein
MQGTFPPSGTIVVVQGPDLERVIRLVHEDVAKSNETISSRPVGGVSSSVSHLSEHFCPSIVNAS